MPGHEPLKLFLGHFQKSLPCPGPFASAVQKTFIKNLHQDGDSAYARYMGDAIFKIPTSAMLSKIVDGIDKLKLGDEDSKGDLYEYLLSKVATAGTNGQFRTPRHIINPDFVGTT